MSSKLTINCNVSSCVYNDKSEFCRLDAVDITSDGRIANRKGETQCASFAQ